MPYGLVESESTAVEDHLVDVGGADSAIDTPDSFVAYDHRNAMKRSFVHSWLKPFFLKFALQLHTVHDMSTL